MNQLLLLITLFSSISLFSQKNDEPHKYCSVLKDGVMTLMQNEKVINTEIVLMDGSRISKGGTVTRTDGSNILLRNGECISINGIIESVSSENSIQSNERIQENIGQVKKAKTLRK